MGLCYSTPAAQLGSERVEDASKRSGKQDGDGGASGRELVSALGAAAAAATAAATAGGAAAPQPDAGGDRTHHHWQQRGVKMEDVVAKVYGLQQELALLSTHPLLALPEAAELLSNQLEVDVVGWVPGVGIIITHAVS